MFDLYFLLIQKISSKNLDFFFFYLKEVRNFLVTQVQPTQTSCKSLQVIATART